LPILIAPADRDLELAELWFQTTANLPNIGRGFRDFHVKARHLTDTTVRIATKRMGSVSGMEMQSRAALQWYQERNIQSIEF
jgi:hypothetical protein